MIEEAEYNYKDFTEPRAGDDKLAIRFFKKAKQDADKTEAEGRPIFVECEYIQINIPGDRGMQIARPVGSGDKLRFARQYEHWKATQTNLEAEGTPLELWGKMTMAQIEEFRYFGVRTVEHLANLRDDLAIKMPGSHELKRKAAEFIALTKEEAPFKKAQAELEKRDVEIATLRQAVEDQAALLKSFTEGKKKAA